MITASDTMMLRIKRLTVLLSVSITISRDSSCCVYNCIGWMILHMFQVNTLYLKKLK